MRRSSRRLFAGGQYRGEARRRDRSRGSEGRLSFGASTAARAGGLRPQTVITNEILAPRVLARGSLRYRGFDEQEPTSGCRRYSRSVTLLSERIGYERGEYRRQADGAAQQGVKEDGDDDGGDGWIGEGRQRSSACGTAHRRKRARQG